MRLDNGLVPLPHYYSPPVSFDPARPEFSPAASRPAPFAAPSQEPNREEFSPFPGVTVSISPETWAAYRLGISPKTESPGSIENIVNSRKGGGAGRAERVEKTENLAAAMGIGECRTCKSRRYQDVSNDASVSFQSPTHISPGQSAALVAAHEQEHVTNEQARADRDGRQVVSQTVALKTAICPECKRVYVSGGETRTITKAAADSGAVEVPDLEPGVPSTE